MAEPAFDPDKYLKEKQVGAQAVAQNAGGFDPDKYLAEKTGGSKDSILDKEIPFIGGTGRGYVQGTLNALPGAGAAAGGLIGGTAGAAAGGVGAIPGGVGGAALGGAGGEALKNLGEKYLLGQDKTRSDIYGKPVQGLATGAEQEMGGQILNKAISSLLGDTVPRSGGKFSSPSTEDVQEAADRLGVKPTQGMLSKNYVEKNLENSISQNPSLAGAYVRGQQRPIQEALSSGANDLVENATSLSPYESGNVAKQGLISKIAEEHDPIKALYKDIGESTGEINLDPKIQSRVANNLRRDATTKLLPNSSSSTLANQFADQIENLKTAAQIEDAQSFAKGILRDSNATFGDKQAASMAIDKLERLNQSSILRSALKTGAPGAEDTAKELIGDIKDARTAYKGLKGNLSTLGEGSGLLSGKGGVSTAVNEIESVPNEQIGKHLFQSQNKDFLDFLKTKYPEAYEAARNQKLTDIAKSSQDPSGEISPKKFMQAIKSVGPEVREHLFGEGANQKLSDMQTLIQSTPAKIGGSDTPRGQSFKELLNPVLQLGDAGRLGLLKAYPAAANNPEIMKLLQSYTGRGGAKTLQFGSGLLTPQR